MTSLTALSTLTNELTMTDEQLIGKFIELRNHVDARSKEFEATIEPYKKAMKTIEDAMSAKLNEIAPDKDGKASIATGSGTVFRKKELAVSIADREVWFDFIGSDFDANKRFLTSAVTKSEVQEFITEKQQLPPGLNAQFIYKTQFRSPNNKD